MEEVEDDDTFLEFPDECAPNVPTSPKCKKPALQLGRKSKQGGEEVKNEESLEGSLDSKSLTHKHEFGRVNFSLEGAERAADAQQNRGHNCWLEDSLLEKLKELAEEEIRNSTGDKKLAVQNELWVIIGMMRYKLHFEVLQ